METLSLEPAPAPDRSIHRLDQHPTVHVCHRGHTGKELSITVATYRTPIVAITLALTPYGMCKLSILDEDDGGQERFRNELQSDWPDALVQWLPDGDEALSPLVESIFSTNQDRVLQIPLLMCGTEFQMDVWLTLRQLAFGTTESYEAVAVRLGQPTAVRAVASAIAANELSVVVPCHRVVRKSGDVGEFRWGAGVKRRLIDWESSVGLKNRVAEH